MGYAIIAELDKDMDGRTSFHRFRYHLASGFVSKNDAVIDLGCGTGYGTEILADKAKFVLGIDFEQSNIDYATEHHRKDNIEYVCSDLESFDLSGCDVAVQLENLEHLYKPKEFLEKLKSKVTKYIIISVPVGQELIEDESGVHEKGDTTHKSVFLNGSVITNMIVDDKWKVLYTIQEGVTFIGIYYSKEFI